MLCDAYQWFDAVIAIIAAVLGALATFVFARVFRKRIVYYHLRDGALTSPEIITLHRIQIRYGDYQVTGRTYFSEIRVKNASLANLKEVTIRLRSKKPDTIKIISVLAKGSSSLVQDRISNPVGDVKTVSVKVDNLPSRAYCDVEMVFESESEIREMEEAVSVEIEGDGIVGRRQWRAGFLLRLAVASVISHK